VKADVFPFSFIANENLLKIPFFQRGYVWGEENWQDIFDDLFGMKESLFFGSLILKHHRVVAGTYKTATVIDGQQRLTTLSILFRALYDTFDADTQTNAKDSLYKFLYYKKSELKADYFIKIEHSKVDAEYYNKVISGELKDNVPDMKSVDKSLHRIVRCYYYFRNLLLEKTEDERTKLYDQLASDSFNILVVITLTDEDDEQAIFDTINSAGIRLSGADIIKNALFQRLTELVNDNNLVYGIYKKNWEDTFYVTMKRFNIGAPARNKVVCNATA
jgi:uncharacterized protein with ParB-like and HNH nuclease domain